jgi:hypothetical protein
MIKEFWSENTKEKGLLGDLDLGGFLIDFK